MVDPLDEEEMKKQQAQDVRTLFNIGMLLLVFVIIWVVLIIFGQYRLSWRSKDSEPEVQASTTEEV